jgi:LPXTG-motif cell wall-anchored protein
VAVVVVPAPTPEPQPEPQPEPKELPKTASPMGLIGLIGFLSATGGYVARFFRR